jgi:hypothetical protein
MSGGGIFLGATQASRLGLLRHSRESRNPKAGQPGRHNKIMKINAARPGRLAGPAAYAGKGGAFGESAPPHSLRT